MVGFIIFLMLGSEQHVLFYSGLVIFFLMNYYFDTYLFDEYN